MKTSEGTYRILSTSPRDETCSAKIRNSPRDAERRHGVPGQDGAAQNTIVGESAGLQEVLHSIEQVAPTDMTVLILGETGTGKELVAQALHQRSIRRYGLLVKVNCSALPGDLIESELFGHERGAFSGAVARQIGRFELAHGATIFLDEIGDLPLRLQAKLLQVLQEGEFERLGSGKTIKVDARVVAATNRNLAAAVGMGRFRADLYYRLNVYPIQVPPLRERREDISLLADAFLGEAGRRLGHEFDPISRGVIEALENYTWPGNVRELRNVIDRAAVTSTGRLLQLPTEWKSSAIGHSPSERSFSNESEAAREQTGAQENSLEQLGRRYILDILARTDWRIEGPRGAAEILGLKPNTLRARLRKLGIERSASNQPRYPNQGKQRKS